MGITASVRPRRKSTSDLIIFSNNNNDNIQEMVPARNEAHLEYFRQQFQPSEEPRVERHRSTPFPVSSARAAVAAVVTAAVTASGRATRHLLPDPGALMQPFSSLRGDANPPSGNSSPTAAPRSIITDQVVTSCEKSWRFLLSLNEKRSTILSPHPSPSSLTSVATAAAAAATATATTEGMQVNSRSESSPGLEPAVVAHSTSLVSGISLFQQEFFRQLAEVEGGDRVLALFETCNQGKNKSATKGTLLITVMRYIVTNIPDDSQPVKARLRALGRRHVQRHINAAELAIFKTVALSTIETRLNTVHACSPHVMCAWHTMISFACDQMMFDHVVFRPHYTPTLQSLPSTHEGLVSRKSAAESNEMGSSSSSSSRRGRSRDEIEVCPYQSHSSDHLVELAGEKEVEKEVETEVEKEDMSPLLISEEKPQRVGHLQEQHKQQQEHKLSVSRSWEEVASECVMNCLGVCTCANRRRQQQQQQQPDGTVRPSLISPISVRKVAFDFPDRKRVVKGEEVEEVEAVKEVEEEEEEEVLDDVARSKKAIHQFLLSQFENAAASW